MTDPHDFENATYYSDATETNLTGTSPAIFISPVAHDSFGRRVSATSTNQQLSALSRPTLPSRETGSADDANHSAEPSLALGQYDLDPPIVTVHDTDSGENLTRRDQTYSSSGASSKLVLAPFGSETWTTTFSGPYLDFAPRPIYEPTGELLREETGSFDRFDSPVESRTLAGASSHQDLTPPFDPASATAVPASSDPKAVNVFVQPSLPRSALKRKAESLESPLTEDLSTSTPKTQGGRPSKARAVSFERMSGPGPASPDEGSTNSDLQTAQGRSDNAAHRRARHSSTSTPRTALQSTSGPTQNTGRSNRGTRAPSGHPPSILPPEKVFPIQIGSELFRLSGASISSDGNALLMVFTASFVVLMLAAPSYFTQFFEEQIRQNEESGGVRTLYIDRDPITFRDVARHLQGKF